MDAPVTKSSPRDVFLHGLLIVTLYMSVISFIVLCFQYVNVLFPDPLTFYAQAVFNSIRWGSSVLIVSFPVFLWLAWVLEREVRKDPAKHELKIRKWLVYLTLFVTAIVIIVDLIILIYNFYGGELTAQFFLKIIVVLAAAAAVFGYYLWDLRRTQMVSALPKQAALGSGVVVLAAVIAGFFIGGSPTYQRDVRFDERRVQDLQSIQSQLVYFWSQKDHLPQELSELQDSISGFSVPVDPLTSQSYEYVLTSDLSFELCATFTQESISSNTSAVQPLPVSPDGKPIGGIAEENWQHDAGRTCFDREIDPELHNQPK
ncbi:MAG: DUF5671 domain-containing protein [Candidatus Andersenbacteria bacterium]